MGIEKNPLNRAFPADRELRGSGRSGRGNARQVTLNQRVQGSSPCAPTRNNRFSPIVRGVLRWADWFSSALEEARSAPLDFPQVTPVVSTRICSIRRGAAL